MNFIPINVEKKWLMQMQDKLKDLESRVTALEEAAEDETDPDTTEVQEEES